MKRGKQTTDSARPLLGCHFSVAGGLATALDRAVEAGCNVAQLFTANPRQWCGNDRLPDAVTAAFRRRRRETGVQTAAHAGYLVNLATPPGPGRERALAACASELRRAEDLGIPAVVIHPGVRPEDLTEDAALDLVVDGIRRAFERSRTRRVSLLLETTSGQGRSLGCRFEQLGELLLRSRRPKRLAVCLDTAHVFAAGYDIRTARAYESTMDALELAVGIQRVRLIHLNDSRSALGSRVDRHEHIGQGHIGRPAFRRLMRDCRFSGIAKCLETRDDAYRAKDLAVLRRMARGTGRRRR
jgi:deoxyribonuclease-4